MIAREVGPNLLSDGNKEDAGYSVADKRRNDLYITSQS